MGRAVTGAAEKARPGASAASAAAETVLRLAVLLQAGLSPARAWEHLAEAGDAAAVRVAEALGERMPLADAIASVAAPAPRRRLRRHEAGRDPWPDVGAAWRVATTVGAPLAESLRGLVETFPGETKVYPGHMGTTTLATERATNPFLRDLAPAGE